MSGETEEAPSGWTIDTALAFLQRQMADHRSLTDAQFTGLRILIDSQADKFALALASSDKAVVKAEVASEKRFESVNEFRAQQRDLIAEFVRMDYMQQALATRDATIAALAGRVRELELSRSTAAGQEHGAQAKVTDQRASLAAYVGLATLAVTIIVIAANLLTGR